MVPQGAKASKVFFLHLYTFKEDVKDKIVSIIDFPIIFSKQTRKQVPGDKSPLLVTKLIILCSNCSPVLRPPLSP